jgi:serine/threonine protein kinase
MYDSGNEATAFLEYEASQKIHSNKPVDCIVRYEDYKVIKHTDGLPLFCLLMPLFSMSLRDIYNSLGDLPLPPKLAFETTKAMLSAGAALHKLELCHCDIKPDNVMLDHDGKIVLIDLGAITPFKMSPREITPGFALGASTILDATWDLWCIASTIAQGISREFYSLESFNAKLLAEKLKEESRPATARLALLCLNSNSCDAALQALIKEQQIYIKP